MNTLNLEQSTIEAIQRGQTVLFVGIIEAYQQQLFRYCYFMLGNKQDAEDSVQEVFIIAYQKLHLYTHHTSLSAWLHKIAANHCLNVIKKRKRLRDIIPRLGASHETESSTYNWYDQNISLELQEMIAKLKPDERNLFILRVIQDKPFEEIATIQKANITTLRKKFERLKRKLQKLLEPEVCQNERILIPGK